MLLPETAVVWGVVVGMVTFATVLFTVAWVTRNTTPPRR
jgi:hypothetical protein